MPPVDGLVVSAGPGETRIAVMAGDRPVEFRIDRGGAAPGNLLLGRVLTVNRALDAAFVDIGEALPGFLPAPAGAGEGAAVLVEVTAAAHGGKGAALTAPPSLAGERLAYSPGRPGLALSRRIPADEERHRLRGLLAAHLATGEGVVVRTAAAGASDEVLLAELQALRNRWRGLQAAVARTAPPARLYAPSALARVVAAYPEIRYLSIDDLSLLGEARALFPAAEVVPGAFDAEAADDLEMALARRAPLDGGGALIIETAAALTAIDVDSGGGAPLAANLAALPEIARQLRLRNLAGHLLIDVIPMKDRRALGRLVEALRRAVAEDPVPTHVVGTTPLGLIEMTRERHGPSLAEVMLAERRDDPSAQTVALAALRAVLRATAERPAGVPGLAVSPAVDAALAALPAAVAETARRLGRPLRRRIQPGVDGFELIEDRP